MENWDSNAIYIFRFRMTLKNRFEFCFLFFVFASLWKTDNKVAEHSFGSLWVYNICKIMAKEPFIRAYKEFLSWVPFHLSLEHMFCATYRRSWLDASYFSPFKWTNCFITYDVVDACNLEPTVFRWHGKMEFKCHLHFLFSHDIEKQILFFVFASLWKTDMNFSFRFSFSHHFEKRIWISFFVFALLVIEKQIGVSFVMNLKSGLIHQSFETPPPSPRGWPG